MRKYALAVFVLFFAGCTVHPRGEAEERRAAIAAGTRYENRAALPEHAMPDDLVRVALTNNAEVEQRYWEWRAAVEQVVIDGTQPTNLAIFGSLGISNGHTSSGQTTIAAGNDPMADIVLPNKLDAAARRSLETARAAGVRFHKAQLDLRTKVLSAYDDYALNAELLRLARKNTDLLHTVASVTEAHDRVGGAGQLDVLKAANEADIAGNDVATMESQQPALRAALIAIVGCPSDATIDVPEQLPTPRPLRRSDADLLARAARQNPELTALADETRSRQIGIEVARLMYQPDLSLTAGTNLSGVAQTLSGMITVPLLKYEAIHAAVAQAEANLRSIQAMRRQTENDLAAQLLMDLATVRDADRQLNLFQKTILPRADQVMGIARSRYESGGSSLLELLDAHRSQIDIQRLVANLQIMRDKRLLELESIMGSETAD